MNLKSCATLCRYPFKWTVDDLSKLPENWEEDSPEFIVEPQSKWHMKLNKKENTYYLYINWSTKKKYKNSYEALVLNSEKQELACYKGSLAGDSTDIIPSNFYRDVVNKLPDGEIIFEVTLQVWFIQSTKQIPEAPGIQQDHLLKLQSDLKNIFTNNIKPDVTLHVDGGTLSAHKAVLMARSEVFAKMFQSGLKEDETGTVDIKDIKVGAMKALLLFMYSAEVTDLDLDTALDVYSAADKYAILDLKNACRRSIASKVTKESATKVLVFAEARGDPILRDSTMEFIALRFSSTKLK